MNFHSELEDELLISLALYADEKGGDWAQIRANVCSRSGRIKWLLRGSAWRGRWLQHAAQSEGAEPWSPPAHREAPAQQILQDCTTWNK